MKSFLFCSVLSLFSISAFAAPTITSVTLENGKLSITGSGFGDTNPMLLWDDVDTTYPATTMSSGNVVPSGEDQIWTKNALLDGNTFQFESTSNPATTTNDVVYRGKGRKAILELPNHATPESVKKRIFVSWWYKPNMDPGAEGGSNKFIRVWDDLNGTGTRISWTQQSLSCISQTDNFVWGHWNESGGKVNEWNHHMILVDLFNESMKTWVNGKIVHDMAAQKSTAATDLYLKVALIGFDHGKEAFTNMYTELDNIYVASSQARVIVSNSNTWSDTMTGEVLPIASWTGNKIDTKSASFKSFKFDRTDSAFVYIVDEAGTHNTEGYRLPCDTCDHIKKMNKANIYES